MSLLLLPKILLLSTLSFLLGGQPLAAEPENGTGLSLGREFKYKPGLNRGDFLKRRDLLRIRHLNAPDDDAVSLEYGRKLFETGDFAKAEAVLRSLPGGVGYSAESMLIAADLEYGRGRYDEAAKLYEKAYDISSGENRAAAGKGLVLTYYQSGQYEKGGQVAIFPDDVGYLRDMMKSFGSRKPFQIEWKEKIQVEVPFLLAGNRHLPIVALKVNGQAVNVIIDTGCDSFDLDEAIAEAAGIEAGVRMTGRFAGGKTADLVYGLADRIELGGLEIKSVPVSVSQIDWEYEDEAGSGKINIGGIIGTGIFKRFLTTLDYPGERLILRPQGQSGLARFRESLPMGTKAVEMPFIMADTHFMLAKGVINGRKGLNMFLDSGLEDPEASILLEKETLGYAGIDIPVKDIVTPEGQGGLGGGGFSVGVFKVDDFYLGPLHQQNLSGLYGIIPADIYFGSGLIIDGIISHNFLKKYSWTIDFESMTMIFSQ